MTLKNDYAIILMKDDDIVQIRTMYSTMEKAIDQAKYVKDMTKNKFDNVMVYKTTPHYIMKAGK
jgi:hypothetical protein